MSALRRIIKVKEGYEVTVSCTNKPTLTAFYRTYEQCEKFADDYFLDYLGVSLNSVHHPEGDGVEPEGLNPESLETIEIEIPMTPEQILRNLDNGYVMNRAEQAEAAQYIRQLQQAHADMLSALRAIVAVAETEDSFSMQTIKGCANIAIKQARGEK
jgi:hypothetical protein